MYKLNDSKMFADVTNNVAIIINASTGVYYGINNCGSLVFQAVINGYSVKTIVDSLKKIDDCPTNIDQKVQEFIKELLQKEIIIESETNSSNPTFDESVIKKDNFEMKVSEYTDVQEMLLADPIHDIDEETGWQPLFKEKKENGN